MAININGKIYRNLEEQVGYLTDQFNTGKLIDELGITVLGVYATLDDALTDHAGVSFGYGDAFSIGTEKPYDLYIYTRQFDSATGEYTGAFVNLGKFPAIGEKGDKGDKGDTGDQGPVGAKGDRGKIGQTGLQGPVGPKGDTGAVGPQGEQGPQGPVGPAFNVYGTLDSTSQLPTPTAEMQDAGACYLIPDSDTGEKHMWVIQYANNGGSIIWVDIGVSGIQGQKGDAGQGINTLLKYYSNIGDNTVTVTDTSIQVDGKGRWTYAEGTHDAYSQYTLPIEANEGVTISKSTSAERAVIGSTIGLYVEEW